MAQLLDDDAIDTAHALGMKVAAARALSRSGVAPRVRAAAVRSGGSCARA